MHVSSKWLGFVGTCTALSSCGAGMAQSPLGLTSDGTVRSGYQGTPLALAGESAATQYTTHTLEKGETIWRVSQQYGTSVETLAALNSIDDPTQVRAGTVLKVPTTSGASTPPPKTTASPSSVGHRAPAAHASKKRYPLHWPVEGTVTSRYGQRQGRAHDGVDIAAPPGARVRAAGDGTVLFSGERGGYGNLILIRHADGLVTVYAHNKMNLVRQGQRVKQGQQIAQVGATGRATGPHLHFEVREGVQPQNPLQFLPP